jgi:hypothetical protein
MISFKRFAESLLLEQPHLSFNLPSGHVVNFDPRLEVLKGPEGFEEMVDMFKRILKGERVVTTRPDGETTSIQLDNEVDMQEFMKEFNENPFVKLFIERRLGSTLEEFNRRVYSRE